jgi:membrane-bound lytic murein transglycosylase D
LQVRNRFTRAGNVLKGVGWIINDRVYVDLGFEGHDVILYDSNSKQGIEVTSLKNDEPLLLKVQYNDD